MRPSYICNGNSYTGKIASLFWDRLQALVQYFRVNNFWISFSSNWFVILYMNGYACEWNQYLMRQISLLACLHNISWSLLFVIDYNITCRMHIEHSVMRCCARNNALFIILQGLIMSCIKWNYILIMFWWAFYALIQGVPSLSYKIHGSKVMPFWPRIEASIPIITGLIGVVCDFRLFPWYWMPFTTGV